MVDAAARTLISVTPEGRPDVACTVTGVPAGLGFLPNGEAIVTDMHGRALIRCVDGVPSTYVDLSPLTGTIDDMTMDGAGRAYVGDLGFDLKEGIKRGPYGRIVLVEPGHEPRIVARDLDFPNGIAISAVSSSLPRPMATAWRASTSAMTARSTSTPGSALSARRTASASTGKARCG